MIKGAQNSLLFWTALVVILAMIGPMMAAASIEDWLIARTFMYYALFSAILLYIYAIALGSDRSEKSSGAALLEASAVFVIVPIIAAAPVVELYPNLGWRLAIFEMISAFTTTGASRMAFIEPVSDIVHLWRAIIGWLGGYYFLLVAYSVLGPLRVNGCDMREDGTFLSVSGPYHGAYDTSYRTVLRRFNKRVFPAYVVFTCALYVLLVISGTTPLPAIVAALSTLSTSGILLSSYDQNLAAELLVFVFLFAALSRFIMSFEPTNRFYKEFTQNPEIRLAIILVSSVTMVLFSRHYLSTLESEDPDTILAVLQALWGGLFTTFSFLTTTGFVSDYWDSALKWAELDSSHLILMALAICGGGVATTAGGIKLLRIYTLAFHGMRELNKLSSPNSLPPSGGARHVRRWSVLNAWVVAMLFAFSIALFTSGFALAGNNFENALVLAVTGLATIGPLASEAVIGENLLIGLDPFELVLLEAAMIVGRLETLAVIALFNPVLWQGRRNARTRRLA